MTIAEAQEKVASTAISQIGYHEKATNSGLYGNTNNGSSNWNKYAYEIDTKWPGYFNGSKNGYEWCTSFVTWCFLTNFGAEVTHKMLYTPQKSLAAGCVYAVNYFKAAGAYYSTPQKGDQWFKKDSAGDPCHTGVVVSVNGSQFDVVEGNANNQVERNTYNVGGYSTHGFGRPKWSAAASSTPTTYTEGWVKDSNGWWYRYKDGSYPKSCWKKISGEWYYFNGEGYAVANQWITTDGNAYYLDGSCKMAHDRTLKIDGSGKLVPAGAFYTKLGDVKSETYRDALDAAIQKGILKGEGGSGDDMVINLTEEAVRVFVYLRRAGVF